MRVVEVSTSGTPVEKKTYFAFATVSTFDGEKSLSGASVLSARAAIDNLHATASGFGIGINESYIRVFEVTE